jgi:hypothetical protein
MICQIIFCCLALFRAPHSNIKRLFIRLVRGSHQKRSHATKARITARY